MPNDEWADLPRRQKLLAAYRASLYDLGSTDTLVQDLRDWPAVRPGVDAFSAVTACDMNNRAADRIEALEMLVEELQMGLRAEAEAQAAS